MHSSAPQGKRCPPTAPLTPCKHVIAPAGASARLHTLASAAAAAPSTKCGKCYSYQLSGQEASQYKSGGPRRWCMPATPVPTPLPYTSRKSQSPNCTPNHVRDKPHSYEAVMCAYVRRGDKCPAGDMCTSSHNTFE